MLWSSTSFALSPEDARHLLARTGFAPTPAEIEPLLALSREVAIDRVIGRARLEARTPPPNWVNETLLKKPPKAGMDRRKKFRQRRRRQGQALAAWWATEMRTTDSPITERMTLFWHGHLPSSLRKVKNPSLLYQQNILLRRHALGSYRAMLHAITRDPAMLLYLDGARSRRGKPNENYARELMELFTIGEGAYTEKDVKETARALTGWKVERETGKAVFKKHRHDRELKTIRGRTGPFTSKDVVDALADDPRTATRLANKLWRQFVSDTPDPKIIAALAQRLRTTDLNVGDALSTLLKNQAFWSARGRLIKSPIELLIGVARQLDLKVEPLKLARQAAKLGQALFQPPNVKGWPGGPAWVSESTYLARVQTLRRLTHRGGSVSAWLTGRSPAQRRAQSVQLELLAAPPTDVEVLDKRATPALVRQLLIDPAYQVN